jgi:tetratricopeptide (TPR) repeat protein
LGALAAIFEWVIGHLFPSVVGGIGLFAVGYVLARPPLLPARKLAYRLDKTDENALKLATISCSHGRRDLERGNRLPRALRHLDYAIFVLAPRRNYSTASRSLYRDCLDLRAQAYAQLGHWTEAAEDLGPLIQDQSTTLDAVRAGWLRRLAAARDNLQQPAEAERLRAQAAVWEKKAAIPATAPSILRMWPEIEYLVLKPLSDSAELNKALENVRALAKVEGTDAGTIADTIYGQALLELKAGDPSAISSLTRAAALLPEDFALVYYWRARARAAAGELQGCLEDCERAQAATGLLGSVRYFQGYAHFGLVQFEDAVDAFAQAIEIEPSRPEAHQGLVLARVRLSQWESVISDCDRALALGINEPLFHAARGHAELNLGDSERALEDSNRALNEFPPSVYAYQVRGLTLFNLRQWKEAERDLTTALELDPKEATVLVHRAEARRMQGEIEKAREDVDLAVEYRENLTDARLVRVLITLGLWEIGQDPKLLDGAESDCARMVAVEPANASAYWAWALVQRARGKTDEALRLATEALGHDPKFAKAYQTRGQLHLDRSEWSKAETDFRSAIAHGNSADSGESYFGLAECQRIQGEIRPAIATYDDAIRCAPNYSWAYYGRGLAYLADGNRAQALEDYTTAINRGARVPELFRERAFAHFDRGDDEAAERDFAEAAELETNPVRTLLEWGTVLVFIGKAEQGIEKFSEALALDPKSDEAYARRGWARGVRGDLDGALEDESKAIALNSKSATYLNNRAWLLCKLERWRRAVIDCDAAIKLDETLAYAFKNRSLAQWRLGRNAEAVGDLGELVRLSQSGGGAPATSRDDLLNWQDQARDWAKGMAGQGEDAVGNLGWGIALWMSGQAGPAEERIRRAIVIDPLLQTGLDVLARIGEQKDKSPSIHGPLAN